MVVPRLLLALAAVLCLWSPKAPAQGNSAALTPNLNTEDPCRTQVAKFERAMSLIRQSQGTVQAAALKEKLLPAKVENDILMKDGYCGLAAYLHEKKLDR